MNKVEKIESFERITRTKLEDMLRNFKAKVSATGVAFGNLVYHTDESGSRVKKGKKMLQKITRVNITIGSNYEGRVNRDLTKQGEEANFTAQERSGMVYVNEEGVLMTDVKTSTKSYLAAIVEHKTKPHTVYFFENKPISKAKAVRRDMFMDSYFEPKKTAGRGEVREETDFHVISPKLENIISITLNKKKYIVID